MKFLYTLLTFLTLFLFSTQSIFASDNQFITIVNPVRIAPYTTKSSESIAAEYSVIKNNSLAATWLVTFDVLSDEDAVRVLREFDSQQETGLFLEVGPLLCEKAKVICNQGSWHHANVIFLSGYKVEDRKKLIDTVFTSFKEKFGYYPKSVGSWWTDAYSLSYMKEQYGITANLTCADQFATDGYQLWGQYWSMPFYPSIYHSGTPAVTKEVQTGVVNIQWAPRDPLNGYYSSLYSTQDYHVSPVNQPISYFEKLIDIYADKQSNPYGQITVGLEADFDPGAYKGIYASQMHLIKQLENDQKATPVTMSEFSKWYRDTFTLTPSYFIQSDDLLGKKQKSMWYQSRKYRLGVVYDEESLVTKVIDFRSYHSNLQEPYYSSPNTSHQLSIMIPSYIDEVMNKERAWNLALGAFETIEQNSGDVTLVFTKGKISLNQDSFAIDQYDSVIPSQIAQAKTLSLKNMQSKTEIHPNEQWLVDQEGITFSALSEHAIHELQRKRTKALFFAVSVFYLVLGYSLSRTSLSMSKKLLLFFVFLLPCLLFCKWWYTKNLETYSASQSEIDVLAQLAHMPPGKVLVYDHECLGCPWSRTYKPAAYANRRSYVENYGKHSIVYNAKVFEAKNQQESREEFDTLNAKYLYLVQYEGLHETIPFSPGDLNIEKVYSNANAELWRVKQ